QLRADVPKLALHARIAGRSAQDVARDVLALSRMGLRNRGHRDASGEDESRHLAYLDEIAESGRTAAERLLARFHGEWNGSVLPAFEECVF
ncbi:glutamate--cysteine ligase, partial [Corallococcus exiguus]